MKHHDAFELRAGPVTLHCEPASLFARRWTCRGTEFLRGVYPAVRDTRWNTARAKVRWKRRDIARDRFVLELHASYGGRSPFFEWRMRLDGGADGVVVMSVDGIALRTFRANRVGFCVLHPAEAAGSRCELVHVDGSRARGAFPREIRPHQPFRDLREIAHSPAPGLRARVRMEGDVFEMEDQRNWTDASFKTYCRPLAQPAPFTLRRGERIRQRVEVSVAARGSSSAFRKSADDPPALLTVPVRVSSSPVPVGLLRTHPRTLPTQTAGLFARAGIAHLRVEINSGSGACRADWSRAVADTVRLGPGAALEAGLHAAPGDRRLDALARHFAANRITFPVRWTVFDRRTGVTTPAVFERVRRVWIRHGVPGELGGGAAGDFVNVNRRRPVVPGMAFASFAIDAQVHAFDDASLVETLTVQPLTVRQTRRIAGGLPVSIAPVSLGSPRIPGRRRGDPRLRRAFGGVWTLGSLAALIPARPRSLTFHGTTGEPGIAAPHGRAVSPALRVLRAYAACGAERVAALDSSRPLQACGLALRHAGGHRVLIGNLRSEVQEIRLAGLAAGPWRTLLLCAERRSPGNSARRLPETILSRGTRPVRVLLPPYAVLQLDLMRIR